MRSPPHVSVVIVSHNRPKNLRRLLVSLRYLTYPDFEVIVVSDINPIEVFPDLWHVGRIKFTALESPSIAIARNRGLKMASGDIVAFCDDDAVPEPTWLSHLVAPFDDTKVGAAGGHVRGRNGFSFQSKARCFDRFGRERELRLEGTEPRVFPGTEDLGIKTEGTNCAFRRAALIELGGFDPAYHYFLDETDLNYRLGLAGWKTAIVPLAQVHHGHAASENRSANQAPKTLFEVGASKGYFMARHGYPAGVALAAEAFCAEQKNRLIEFMVRGELAPEKIPALMTSLKRGLAEGRTRTGNKLILTMAGGKGFHPFQNGISPSETIYIAGPARVANRMKNTAIEHAKHGELATVLQFSWTALLHRQVFMDCGYWLQTGGIFGRLRQSDSFFSFRNLSSRAVSEMRRLNDVRPRGKLVLWKETD
ncbi:MAG: glycosyltransferase [Rhodobacterales bacterium]